MREVGWLGCWWRRDSHQRNRPGQGPRQLGSIRHKDRPDNEGCLVAVSMIRLVKALPLKAFTWEMNGRFYAWPVEGKHSMFPAWGWPV